MAYGHQINLTTTDSIYRRNLITPQMDPHCGKDIHPSERTDVSLPLNGFDNIYVVRFDTVLRHSQSKTEDQLNEIYAGFDSVPFHNMSTGESMERRTFHTPTDDSQTDHFESVTTQVWTQNPLFVDLITVAKLTPTHFQEIVDGERHPADCQHQLESLLASVETITLSFTCEADSEDKKFDGLPVSSGLVAVPSNRPPLRTAEDGLQQNLVESCVRQNDDLLRPFGLVTSPISAVTPEEGREFLFGCQPFSSRFGPFSAVYFGDGSRARHREHETVESIPGIRALLQTFRRFNWLHHRTAQVGSSEQRLLEFDTRVSTAKSESHFIASSAELDTYEELISNLREDINILSQIEEESRALDSPYRESRTFSHSIESTFPVRVQSPFSEVLGESALSNLRQYCVQQESFLLRFVERLQQREEIARDSLLAELSVVSSRENIWLQRWIVVLTVALLILTAKMALPI